MNILLIDADSTIPNLALMKLSTYYKNAGHTVSLKQLDIPYYPNRKKKLIEIDDIADKKHCSVIFDGTIEYIKDIHGDIDFGGTGYSLEKKLPDEIENLDPDYSLYKDVDTSIGFITRGCIRNCYFCKVPKKEGMIHLVNTPENIIKHKKVKFFDNNILAYPEHEDIFKRIIKIGAAVQFNQGLDIRLLNESNSKLLGEMKYLGDYYFAFDDIKYKKIIEEKINLLSWRRDWQIKFFIYINPNMDLSATVKRIEWVRENKCLPYLMRDVSCWENEYNEFYIDLAAYCNQPNLFKKMTFQEFLPQRHTKQDRIQRSTSLYNNNI